MCLNHSISAKACVLDRFALEFRVALRKVACGQAPSPGSAQPKDADFDLRARLSHLLDAMPEGSKTVHKLDESCGEEDKWTAVAGLVYHYKGQLRLLDPMQWMLMDINSNSESASKLLSELRPVLTLMHALVSHENSRMRIPCVFHAYDIVILWSCVRVWLSFARCACVRAGRRPVLRQL